MLLWNETSLGSPPDFHFDLSECLSLSFRPSYYVLDAWRKEFASNSSAFPGLTPSLTPHILFSIPRHFLLFWSRAAMHAICHIFQRPQEKSLREKKCKLAPLKKIGAKNSMTLSAGELTPFGIRNVMCSILSWSEPIFSCFLTSSSDISIIERTYHFIPLKLSASIYGLNWLPCYLLITKHARKQSFK